MEAIRKSTAYQSIFGKPGGPSPVGPRQHLQQGLGTPTQPFTMALGMVNHNLASHGSTDLTPMQSAKYIKRAKKVENMTLSNTGAHVESAMDWAKQGNGTGVFMNLSAAFFTGVRDHANYKTGKVFRSPSKF